MADDGFSNNILLLGGIRDAVIMCEKLLHKLSTNSVKFRIIYSLAGLTNKPKTPQLSCNINEKSNNDDARLIINNKPFGGVGGLCEFIKLHKINLLINATQPYAYKMSENAKKACEQSEIAYFRYLRPAWIKQKGDSWRLVNSIEDALEYSLRNYSNIFVACGISKLDDEKLIRAINQHGGDKHIWLRSISMPSARLLSHDNVSWVKYLGQPTVEDEIKLFKELGIEVILSKNSGGQRAYAKIAAARAQRLGVIMIKRQDALQNTPKNSQEFDDINELVDAAMRNI